MLLLLGKKIDLLLEKKMLYTGFEGVVCFM